MKKGKDTIMEITWKHIFDLANKLWDLNQTDIADILDVNKSTISRLINGKTEHFTLCDREIYERLFDSTNPKNLSYNKINARQKSDLALLSTVKKIIKEEQGIDISTEVTAENYRDFMIKLIKQARKNSTKPTIKTKSKSPNSNTIKNRPIPPNVRDTMLQENSLLATSEISIRSEYHKCFYCKWFVTPNQALHNFFSNENGICNINKENKLSTETACTHFLPNNKIIHSMLSGNLPLRDKFHL